MKVLVVLPEGSSEGILIKLHTSLLVSEVLDLVGRGKHSNALVLALSKGVFERKIDDLSAEPSRADLILFKDAARWDLKK